MMSTFLGFTLLVLAAALVAGLLATLRGPDAAGSILGAQLLGTTGVAFLLILAEITGAPALVDVALVLAVLAGVLTLAFVRLHAGDGGYE